jgi:DNA-binding GntR family transcriptional regulator
MRQVPPIVKREDPPYLQVTRHLRESIERGDLKVGDRVPSEREIVDQYGVSRATATKVLATLRADGLVESRPGSGTVVRSMVGLADFTLVSDGEQVMVAHTPCGNRHVATDLREATNWATTHRCDPSD